MSRRSFIRGSVVMDGTWMIADSILVESIAGEARPEITKSESSVGVSKVYMLKNITPQNMIHLYDALERKAKGKMAVKLSTGESGGHNFLQPTLIKDLVKRINDTVVECNTAHGGGHADTDNHLKAAADHGFTAIVKVGIMDADGKVALPVRGGKHLKEDFVGSHYLDYDFTVVLSHLKEHAIGNLGGALRNISISIASSAGKVWVHTTDKTETGLWNNLPERDHFLESMAETAKAMTTHCDKNVLYISVVNRLSVDCDCGSNPEEPEMADIGMLASLDSVALDKACVDLVYVSSDPGRIHLIRRVESRHDIHVIERVKASGMESRRHDLVSLDDK